ncbi:GNAT family N-acetyltransferase [Ideonella sp. YS5]|uniref:GNAT family N-acetyltransferase n=1 Tax=Ideonella sp. YS5 TaxID=3453714 RepID=UPI003EEB36BC
MDASAFIEQLQEGVAPPTFRIHRYPAGMIDRLNLPGQRSVVLRPILPQDADAEQRFVTGLSLASRHKRFHVGLRQLSPSTLRQMTEIDYRDHVALVAQVQDDSRAPDAEPEIVADARYVRLAGTNEAEFAIAVADEWQSLGLGRALMARLARHAKAQGLDALVGDVLPENRRMIVLMRGLGATTRPHPDGPSLVQVVYGLAST